MPTNWVFLLSGTYLFIHAFNSSHKHINKDGVIGIKEFLACAFYGIFMAFALDLISLGFQ